MIVPISTVSGPPASVLQLRWPSSACCVGGSEPRTGGLLRKGRGSPCRRLGQRGGAGVGRGVGYTPPVALKAAKWYRGECLEPYL